MVNLGITIPQYYQKYIDNTVNLNDINSVCCPFHKEHTPSFVYKQETGTWRCYGACKTGGTVIDLHRMNYKLKNNTEAEASLRSVLGLPTVSIKSLDNLNDYVFIDEDSIELDRIYNLCLMYAKTVDRWLEMDYVMSIYPVEIVRLKNLLKKWNVKYS